MGTKRRHLRDLNRTFPLSHGYLPLSLQVQEVPKYVEPYVLWNVYKITLYIYIYNLLFIIYNNLLIEKLHSMVPHKAQKDKHTRQNSSKNI